MDSRKIFVLCGTAGAGAGSVAERLVRLLEKEGALVGVVREVTTRLPREGEDGENGSFLTEELYGALERQGKILGGVKLGEIRWGYRLPEGEWAVVVAQGSLQLWREVKARYPDCAKGILLLAKEEGLRKNAAPEVAREYDEVMINGDDGETARALMNLFWRVQL